MTFAALKRHPIPVRAFFRHSLVLTYALPEQFLQPLLPRGLELDRLDHLGFLAIALVQTEGLRPTFLPSQFGQDFFLSGYRIFTRFRNSAGRNLRGLKILRSDTDRALLVFFGNLLTHYHYQHARVKFSTSADTLECQIETPRHVADLHVIADLTQPATNLPAGSPFADFHQARLFAGPLPFTFDYEAETNSIICIEGVREKWNPQPVAVRVLRNTFLEQPPFRDAHPVLANAFHVANIPYRWKRGVREPLPNP